MFPAIYKVRPMIFVRVVRVQNISTLKPGSQCMHSIDKNAYFVLHAL